mmetsp:Transcript_9460/g.15319  ORF Transcript_9460/g.15319 Transcript_9460/m.15319 type:complete len:272 (-) Transcript_9460:7-822(-)
MNPFTGPSLSLGRWMQMPIVSKTLVCLVLVHCALTNSEQSESCAISSDELSMLQVTYDMGAKINPKDNGLPSIGDHRRHGVAGTFRVLQHAAAKSSPCKSGADQKYESDGLTSQAASLISQPASSNTTSNATSQPAILDTTSNATPNESLSRNATTSTTSTSTTFNLTSFYEEYGDAMNMSKANMRQSDLPPHSRHVNARTIAADWLQEYENYAPAPPPSKEPVPSWWDRIWTWLANTWADIKKFLHPSPAGVATIALTISALILAALALC